VQRILSALRHVLHLDQDLSGFYALADRDPALRWVASGAGRMLRSATLFEEVCRTICTTNCAWSATERMVGALVEQLGEPAQRAPGTDSGGRAFPTPEVMAAADDGFYRTVVRAGYRGRYLRHLAQSVADGVIDLDAAINPDLDDGHVERNLRQLPGVGPYAAAHIMLLSGRCSRLILDSWTRPKYAQLIGRRRPVPDPTIERKFRQQYGEWAGLAFWLTVTGDWV
jgi:N-glycosylase/DNA lyase